MNGVNKDINIFNKTEAARFYLLQAAKLCFPRTSLFLIFIANGVTRNKTVAINHRKRGSSKET